MQEMFDLLEALTPKRIELFRTLSEFEAQSIRELAEIVHRDVKNVWDDLKALQDFDLISFEQFGRSQRPIVKKQIIITMVEVRK